MKKIYVVTYGEYSDYKICNVLSTKEKAEEYVSFYNAAMSSYYDTAQIEVYELDKLITQIREGLKPYIQPGATVEAIYAF